MAVKKTLVFAVRFLLLLTLVFALSSNQAFPQNEEVVEVYLRLEPDRANFGQIDPGKYSPLKSFTLSTNFTDKSHGPIGKTELQHPKGYKIPEENIIILPERLIISYDDPAKFRVKLKIPEEAIAGEYSGKVTFEIKEASTTLAIRVSVSPWLKITGNPVDFGEVRPGKESEDKPFTLTSNLPELTEIAVKKYDLIDNKGHKILKDNVIISPERLRVSAAFPQRFSLRVKVPEGTPEGKYEGKISFLIGGREKVSLPARVKVIPFPAVTLLPLYPDKLLRHQPLRITAKLTPPELEILEIPIEITYPDATLHPLILRREQKGIFSNKGEEFKPTKIGEYTFAIQPSQDYRIKNGKQRIKVNPPVITISPKSASFGRLRKGEKKAKSFVLSVEEKKIFGNEPFEIRISDISEGLSEIGIGNEIEILVDREKPPLEVALSPLYPQARFEVIAKAVRRLRWREYPTEIYIRGLDMPPIVIPVVVKGRFPMIVIWIIVSGIVLVLGVPSVKRQIKKTQTRVPSSFEFLTGDFPVRIGRGKRSEKGENRIALWDPSISPCHAEIRIEENEYIIKKEEGSLYLNDESIDEGKLQEEDIVRIGEHFRFRIGITEKGIIFKRLN